MNLSLTPESLIAQLGYVESTQTLVQAKAIIENTKDFDLFSKHIIPFNDTLAVEKAFIAMSNSEDYLKIKCDEDINASNLEAFIVLVTNWAKKYKLNLQKVPNKNTYYILGLY